jgi:large subunit ribosomal protein L25
MSEQELKATTRAETGKSNVRRLRKTGYVPCTIYGVEDSSVSLTINRKELEKLLSEAHSVIKLVNEGNEQRCVIKEIQYHPVKGEIIHVDLQRIKAGQEIQLSVPIKFIGEAPGVKVGGVFQTIKSELDISTLPKYLPNEIEIDISSMELGDTIHVSDLSLDNITIHHELESSICSIVLPKKVEEPVVAEEEGEEAMVEEEEEAAEPEVISSKAKDEEEEKKSDEG